MEAKHYASGNIFPVALGAIAMSLLGNSLFAVAIDVDEKRCTVAAFNFRVNPSECASIKSYGSEVVTFGLVL